MVVKQMQCSHIAALQSKVIQQHTVLIKYLQIDILGRTTQGFSILKYVQSFNSIESKSGEL